MSSVLNPEAPEFYPLLESATQDGFLKVNKTVKASNNFPLGTSHSLFKTFTEFNVVTYQISENVVDQSNDIIRKDITKIKLKRKDADYNTEKITDSNDCVLDRVNINIDTLKGVNKPDDIFIKAVKNEASSNNAPVVAKIQVGSTLFIGAKNVTRPQLTFKDTIDNSGNLWVPKISDKPNNIKPLALNILYNEEGVAVGYEHPYKVELDLYHPPSQFIEPDPKPPIFPNTLEQTKLTYITTEAELDELVRHLMSVKELAVDVEHHSYRTYQGFTCLIQISTDEGGDFIIDTLVIREHIHKLNLVFTDPKKIKVFHGAECDVIWLQRDFGLYLVGMFDTHQAAKALYLPGLSLKHLLKQYCKVETDKRYQLADWRMRPLPDELIEYARLDTHYLLYIWRTMKNELLEKSTDKKHLLDVFEQSRQICGATYNKEVISDTSHLPLYIRSKKSFNSQQMAALKMLFKWRDIHARELDESTTYLLPNHMLLSLAELLPREVQGINSCCTPMPPFVKQNIINIHRMILSCRELPNEPQLYQMPNHIRSMLSLSHAMPTCGIHDFSYFLEYNEDLFTKTASYLKQIDDLMFKVEAFLTMDSSENYPYQIVCEYNGEAKYFIPPFERYKRYRILAQVEEMKEFKEKGAKIAAISKGNELIKAEVLAKLQKNKNKAIENKGSESTSGDNAPVAADDSDPDANAQRKKKRPAETEIQKRKPLGQTSGDNSELDKLDEAQGSETNFTPYQYKNVNYKGFYE